MSPLQEFQESTTKHKNIPIRNNIKYVEPQSKAYEDHSYFLSYNIYIDIDCRYVEADTIGRQFL